MKTKLVLWGVNEKEEKLLLALQLRPEDNKVDFYTFPEAIATEEFGKLMLDGWRNDQEVTFPEGHTHEEHELSITGSLLPENIKVEREDILQRAQTEWHFIVLSSKLNKVYEAELQDFKEKIEKLKSYDAAVWDGLKAFWSKVQTQVRERNLFRDHANTLRDNTNALFSKMKELRSSMDEEFQSISKEHFDTFMKSLEDVENRIKEEIKLQKVFDELKQMQRNFRDTKLTREHRSKIWERLDSAFKKVKEKRFGPNAGDSSPFDRLKRRYDGLLNAIRKMESSIHRDRDDLQFQNKKIATTDGQLEAQIRQAKLKMIEERIRSKEEKLSEMLQTKKELEQRLKSLEEKEAQKAERDKVAAAREAAKEKIAEEIKQAEQARVEDADHLEKAAEAITAKPPAAEKEKMSDAIGATMGEALEDVVDTIKAVAEVMGGKIETAVKEVKTKVEKAVEAKAEKVEKIASDDLKKVEGIGPKIEELLNQADITSYAQLASASVDKLQQILADAGKRYASHDPGTWPAQAEMASKGEWEKLKAWQDELDGGRLVKDSSEEE